MFQKSNDSESDMPTKEERSLLRDLIRGVVRAQGNVFIKELIRGKVKIGSTKEDFERNLSVAIDEGKLRLSQVEAWLQEIEGWGNQQITLCRVPPELATSGPLASEMAMKARAVEIGYADLWNAPVSQVFPETPQLTSVLFADGVLTLTWHEGEISWVRGPAEVEMDYRKEVGLEEYEFRAHRRFSNRRVARFEVRRDWALAAIFVDLGVASTSAGRLLFHEIISTAENLIGSAFIVENRVPIGDVIKTLDQEASRQSSRISGFVRTHSTRLTGKAAYVELASSTGTGSYLDDPEIGAVRKAITPSALTVLAGTKGDFELLKETGPLRLSQNVRVYLDGVKRRLTIRKQMKSAEIWAILKFLNP